MSPGQSRPVDEELASRIQVEFENQAEKAERLEEESFPDAPNGGSRSITLEVNGSIRTAEIRPPDRTLLPEALDRYQVAQSRLHRSIANLRAAFDFSEDKHRILHWQRNGRLSHRDLYRSPFDERVFSQRVPQTVPPRLGISLLIDDSGSMYSERAPHAYEAALVIIEALSGHERVFLDVHKHSTGDSRGRPYDDGVEESCDDDGAERLTDDDEVENRSKDDGVEEWSDDDDLAELLRLLRAPECCQLIERGADRAGDACLLAEEMGEGNLDDVAISTVAARLLARTPHVDRRCLVVISDGAPPGVDETREVVDRLRREHGMQVIGVAIDDYHAEEIYSPAWTVKFSDLPLLVNRLSVLLKKIVLDG